MNILTLFDDTNRIAAVFCAVLLVSFVTGCCRERPITVEYAMSLVTGATEEDRSRGASCLRGFPPEPRAIKPLAENLSNGGFELRWNSAETLAFYAKLATMKELGLLRRYAVVPLCNALRDERFQVRYHAAEALGMCRDARAVEPLIESLDDDKYSVRSEVMVALARLGDPRAVKPLLARLPESAWYLPGMVGSAAEQSLRSARETADPETRQILTDVLEFMAKYKSGERMHPHPYARYRAVDSP